MRTGSDLQTWCYQRSLCRPYIGILIQGGYTSSNELFVDMEKPYQHDIRNPAQVANSCFSVWTVVQGRGNQGFSIKFDLGAAVKLQDSCECLQRPVPKKLKKQHQFGGYFDGCWKEHVIVSRAGIVSRPSPMPALSKTQSIKTG